MRVVSVDISTITVDGRYREEMGDLEELANSIKEKGVLQPVLINAAYRLLAGHRRLLASQKAGLTTIPASILGTDAVLDEKEIELYENIHRKDFTWTERARLEKDIFTLKSKHDPNWTQGDQAKLLDTGVGSVNRRLQMAELLTEIPELANCKTETEAWKVIGKIKEAAVVQHLTEQAKKRNSGDPGYVDVASWAVNHYKVGSCLDEKKGLFALNKAFDFAEVDPPYAIDLQDKKSRNSADTSQYNEIKPEDYPDFLHKVATGVFQCLRDNTFCVWWYGVEWQPLVLGTLREVGFKVHDIPAIWYKGNVGQTNSPDTMLASAYETFFVARKGHPKLAMPGRSNVFQHSMVPHTEKIHPTEKPIELMLEILRTFLFPGCRFVVPFLGSGTTLRAAYRLNHLAFGWDLSEEYKRKFLVRVQKDQLDGVRPEKQKAIGEEGKA